MSARYESISVISAPPGKIKTAFNGSNGSFMATHHTSIECDYEKNPTSLYKLLEQSEWKLCRIRARTFVDEVQTWVVRRDKLSTKSSNSSSNNNIKWRLLPLHASILFRAPYDVVEALIQAYPEAIYIKDSKGRIPIALAKNAPAKLESAKDIKSGSAGTLMRLYADAALQASQRNEEGTSDNDRNSNNEPFNDKLMTSSNVKPAIIIGDLLENERRDPHPTSIVKGTVVEPPNRFNDMMHLTELRTQAEAHERQTERINEDHEMTKRANLEDFEERTKSLEKVWKSKLSLQKGANDLEVKTIQAEHEEVLQKLRDEHDLVPA